MSKKITLYWNPISAPSRAVKMVLESKGVSDVSYIVIEIMKGEQHSPHFVSLNPNHTVPVLDHEGFVIYESTAIARYLHNLELLNEMSVNKDIVAFPLFPSDLSQLAVCDEYLEWHNSNLRQASYECGKLAEKALSGGKTVSNYKEEFEVHHKLLESSLKSLNERLQKNSFLAGNEISFADLQAAEEVTHSRLWDEDLSGYPMVSEWLKKIEALPKWDEVHVKFFEFLKK